MENDVKMNRIGKFPTSAFVKQELSRLNVRFQKTNGHYMMLCCFHRDNKTPSLSINVDNSKVPPGTFSCFGCHISGSWNMLAKHLGLAQWGKEEADCNYYVDKSVKEIRTEIEETGLTLSKWDEKWRKYSPEFLHIFKVKKLTDKRNGLSYMWIPLTYGCDMQGYVRVRISNKDKGPKYFFSPNMTKVLFPGDFLLKFNTPVVILVEGIADAMRLVKYKMASASILGTCLLPLMKDQLEIMGVKKAICCLDGDRPGRRATKGYMLESGKRVKGLLESVEDLGIEAIDFKLPKENDPDDAPLSVIKELWKVYKEAGGIKLNY